MSFAVSKALQHFSDVGKVSILNSISRRYTPIKLLHFGTKSSSEQDGSISSSFLNSILKMSRTRRWFENPYPDFQLGGNNAATNLQNVRKVALEQAEKVLAKGVKSGDGGVYVGAVGCTYMILHILNQLTEEELKKYMPLAVNAYHVQSLYFQQNPGERNGEPAFLLGKAGHYVIGAVLGQAIQNEQLINDCVQKFVSAAEVCQPVDFFRQGGDELFVGRAGYLCGALYLQQKLGYQPVPDENLEAIWTSIIESGVKYSKRHKSPCPLMYSYYGTEYLGAAHGLAAILQMLISFPAFLNKNQEAATAVKTTIDYYLTLQTQTGNFPCAMDEIGTKSRHPDELLVHWCHGSPGAIYLFAKAYKYYNEQKYLNACVACGDLVWARGLLRKGPGICHGVAGSGYVFLVINQLLGGNDAKSIYRAGKFAEFLEDSQFLKEARNPDCPYSLYEGWAGTVCYLMDLLQPGAAEFPFFNLDTQYNG